MSTGVEWFYPYLTGIDTGDEGGNTQFNMEVLEEMPLEQCRIVLTPSGNRAAVWNFGAIYYPIASYNVWSVFLVDHEVLFAIGFADLERFWSVCDRAASATVALSGPRDCGHNTRPCSLEEIERRKAGPSQEELEDFTNFVKSFSCIPVVDRILFKILFPKEVRPRPVN